ncbi:MAG: hypothetical protein JO362_23310 [Streptomycetaceae bacterium]|nr:hypothetical protein [Streptomycetaceae bacterium]
MNRPAAHEWAVLGEDRDPVPGDPEAVVLLALTLREVADDIVREANEIKALASVESWKSKAADEFRKSAGKAEEGLRKAFHRYGIASEALGTSVHESGGSDPYAAELAKAQRISLKALRDAQAADADHRSAQRALDQQPQHTPADDPLSVSLRKKRDAAAADLKSAHTLLDSAKDIRDAAAKRAAHAIHRAITHDGLHDSGWDEFKADVGSVVSGAGHIAEDVGLTVLSGLASFGNAALHDPGSLAAVAGGLGLMVLGAGGEVGGTLVACTGVGVIPGAAIDVFSAGMIASGVGMAGLGLASIASDAAGPDRVDMTSQGSGGGGSGTPSSDEVGGARERKVADLTGGRVPSGEPGKPGIKITQPGAGSSDIDVIGGDGSYIQVGGPAKAKNLAKLGQKLNILKWQAGQDGVGAQAYFARGTPDSALDLARKILGPDNVHVFDE